MDHPITSALPVAWSSCLMVETAEMGLMAGGMGWMAAEMELMAGAVQRRVKTIVPAASD